MKKKSEIEFHFDDSDTGDVTLERYKYQIIRAAIYSMGILIENMDITEVFCEHVEDILLKHKDSSYTPIQIKTRDLKYGPFKATDEAVLKSLAKFIKLQALYPNQIRCFQFITNVGIYDTGNTSSCLKKIIEYSQSEECLKYENLNSKYKTFISKLKKYFPKNTTLVEEQLLNVLLKLSLKGDSGNIEDSKSQLINALIKYDNFSEKPVRELRGIADNLVQLCFEASSSSKTSLIFEYFSFEDNYTTIEQKALIQSKKLTHKKIEECLRKGEEDDLAWFFGGTDDEPYKVRGVEILELKLKKGDVSDTNIEILKDAKYSMEYQHSQWVAKLGTKKARERYEQIKAIMKNYAQQSYDKNYNLDKPFGTKMLISIRDNIDGRYLADKPSFCGCMPETAIGLIAIMTEDCKIWWSQKFNIPE